MSRARRIAILGGGLAGLSAAHELTRTADRRARYEVTLYQMGWRLGGKAASGRGLHGRVEEHGLHLLFGFYDNVFSLVRSTYDELDGSGNLPSWRDVFVPQHTLDLWNRHDDELHRWRIRFPSNEQQPGDHEPRLGLAQLLERAVSFSLSFVAASLGVPSGPTARLAEGLSPLRLGDVQPVFTRVWAYISRRASDSEGSEPGRAAPLVAALARISGALGRQIGWLADRSLAVHRAWIAADWALTVLRGVLRDDLAHPQGWRKIDHLDYRDWLATHGAAPRTLDSALVRAYYSAVLAVPEDGHVPAAAGTALRTQLRMFLTYRGAFLYKVRTGLGDGVIAPLYKVLQGRGVRFRWFHKVVDVVPQGGRVASIHLRRQARLRGETYDPLVRVGNLDCWPGAPRWEQLEGEPRASGYPFEHELGLPPSERIVGDALQLVAGRDFDAAIFAVPLGAIPSAAPSLLAASPRWRAMVHNVRDIATQSFQLWLRDDPRQLGWEGPPAFCTTFRAPVDTWADVSFVLEHEDWPARDRPRGLLYFTGFLDHGPTRDDPAHVRQQWSRVRQTMERTVRRSLVPLFPGVRADGVGLLHRHGSATDALAAQYLTANVEPWERYVLACPGTNEYRLPAGDTGFANLAVAGDWIANGVYSGCAEGAVIGGMQAARAVGCEGVDISGEDVW